MGYLTNSSNAISVTNFGAVADGITDNTEAFRRSIEFAKVSNVRTIIVPAGTYRMGSPVYITGISNLTIVGEGAYITTSFEQDFRKFYVSGARNINFRGLSFDGGRTGTSLAASNFSGIITYDDSKQGTVENCEFYNQRGSAILIYGSTNSITVDKNYFTGHFCGVYSFSKTSPTGAPSQITVTNNQFGPTWANGGETACIKLQNGIGQNVPSYGHLVANNNISSTCQMGVEFWGGLRNITVVGNIFSGTEWGISLDNVRDATVDGNTCVGNSFAGIETASFCENVVVNGNIVDYFITGSGTVGAYGLLVANGQKAISMSNNYVRGYNNGCQIFGTNEKISLDNNSFNDFGVGIAAIGLYKNLSFTNNKFESGIRPLIPSYLLFLDVSSNASISSGVTIRGNHFNCPTTDQSIFYYNNGTSGSITNVVIENNVVGPQASGGGNGGFVFIGGQFIPYNAIYRNNFSVSGATSANSIADYSVSSTPYGTTNVSAGYQYYGSSTYTIPPTVGITGDGAWMCVWSGGEGLVNNIRAEVLSVASINNTASTIELWASMMPYRGSELKHTLTSPPNGIYQGNYFTQSKTLSHDTSNATNSLWIKLSPTSSGAGKTIYTKYSNSNLLLDPYVTYTEPADTQNNAKLYFAGSNTSQQYFQTSNGYEIGNAAALINAGSGKYSFLGSLNDPLIYSRGNIDTTYGLRQGLAVSFYTGLANYGHPNTTAEMNSLFLTGLRFVSGGYTSNVSGFTHGFEQCASEFVGYFLVTGDGLHTFGLNSDDASDLFIDGNLASYWYGGHGTGTSPAGSTQNSLFLASGLHRLVARTEDGGASENIQIWVKTPGDTGIRIMQPNQIYSDAKDYIFRGNGNNGNVTFWNNVLMGTNSTLFGSNRLLNVSGATVAAILASPLAASPTLEILNNAGAGDNTFINFYTEGGTPRGSVTYNRAGGVVAYNTSSDERLKENIRSYHAVNLIDSIQPRIFDWKSGSKDSIGFIAQELYPVYPLAVTTGELWSVDASKLIPLLVAEIQDNRKRISYLESIISGLS